MEGAASGVSTIISPGWLVASADEQPRHGASVRIVRGHIDAVDDRHRMRANHPDDEEIDAPECVLMPGFVNAHTHLYGTLAHGIPVDPVTGFWSFLADYWWPKVEDHLDHTMIEAATDWVCADMLRGGTTSFYDILEAPNAIPDALSAETEVVERRGLRAVLSFEATERVSALNGMLGLMENARFIQSTRRPALVSGMMCFHTTFTCSGRFIQTAFSLAGEHDVPVHAHCNEGVHEAEWCLKEHGMRTLEYYDSLGVLSPRFLASQCVQISEHERHLIAERGVRVSHMPLANCEVGGGIAPIPELLAAGVTVGLGSDGYVNDFFEVMRGASLLHKARLLDPSTMPAATVMRMATEGAARAIGLDMVGRIQPGWVADVQLVDARFPTPVTAHNLFDQLVLWRNQSHVRDVMVAGQWRVRNGEVLDADIDALRAHVREQAARLWARA